MNTDRIWIWFADNGNIRKWDSKPFPEGTEYVAALSRTAQAPVADEVEAGARLIAKWLGYSWDGLHDGSVVAKGFPVFTHGQFGWKFQGHKDDVRDLVRDILALASSDPAPATEAAGETLGAEFDRLIREYQEPDADGTRGEAWNLIADFAVANSDAILSAIKAQPAAPVGKWAIDNSTPSPILTYENCSVIQDEQAYHVLELIRRANRPSAVTAQAPVDVREALEDARDFIIGLGQSPEAEGWPRDPYAVLAKIDAALASSPAQVEAKEPDYFDQDFAKVKASIERGARRSSARFTLSNTAPVEAKDAPAAPDLLEALSRLVEVCEKQPRISKAYPEPNSPLGMARAAIAKATGRTLAGGSDA